MLSYSVVSADTLRDLVTSTFNLLILDSGYWSYMAIHVFNLSTKFKDHTLVFYDYNLAFILIFAVLELWLIQHLDEL